MNFFDGLIDTEEQEAMASRIQGVVVGVVTNNKDPELMGCVKVKLPWLSNDDESQWARIAVPMAGKERGFYFLPEVDDEVLVAFEHGDVRYPYVLGALWNGKEAPPAKNEDGKNNIRVIKSRSGHKIILDDSDDQPAIKIIDKTGENSISIDSANNAMEIRVKGDLTVDVQGNISITAKGKLEIEATGPMTLKSSAKVSVDGTGQTEVKAATVSINGSSMTEVKGRLVKIN